MADFVIINPLDILSDTAEILRHGISALGHRCSVQRPQELRLQPSAVHILFDSPSFPLARLPDNVVVFNLEQFGSGSSLLTPAYLESLRGRILWDYSRRNLDWMRANGIAPRLAAQVRLGHAPALVRRPAGPVAEDIDVLFYGTVNRRRLEVLRGLADAGLRVTVLTGGFASDVPQPPDTRGLTIAPPAFGEELDRWVARARLVLNVHYYDTRIFEIVRLAPLLASGRAVVAEVEPDTDIEPDLRDAVAGAPRGHLVDLCRRLLADDAARRALGERAAARFAARDAAEGLRPAVDATLATLFPAAQSPAAPLPVAQAPAAGAAPAEVVSNGRPAGDGVETGAGPAVPAPATLSKSGPTMRLSACLIASDLNPLYLDFFPLVHKVWTEVVGVKVKLALIADEMPEICRPFADDVLLFPPVPGIRTAFQAQCIRLLYPALMEPEADGGAVVISDMDMIPMCRRYYADTIAGFSDDTFVVYRGNVLIHDSAQIAMCYNAARPAVWNEIFGAPYGGLREIADVRRILADWARQCPEYDGEHGGQGWSFDQRALFSLVRRWASQPQNKSRIAVLDDQQTGFLRLDRLDLMRTGALSMAQAERVRDHLYTDYHLLRPHADYRVANERIVQILLDRRI